MYTLALSNIDKKVHRAVKGLKSKNGHSLYVADQLLKNVHSNLKESTKLTLIVTDTENELDYTFEDKKIDPSDAAPSLMEILEEDIIASGHENAQKILSELERQYQMESEQDGAAATSETVANRSERSGKKGVNLLARFKKSGKTVNQNNPLLEDFEELDESLQAETATASDFDDMNQKEDSDTAVESWESSNDLQGESVQNSDEVNLNQEEFPTQQEEVHAYEPAATEDGLLIADEFVDEESSYNASGNNEKTNADKKNERIVFPTYDSYLNLGTSQNIVNRQKDRFEPNHLINFLGLNTSGVGETDLDRIKFQYAANALNDSKFVLLKDYFYNAISNIQDQTETNLSQAYEEAMGFDYQEVASKKIEEDVQAVYKEGDYLLSKYQEEQAEEIKFKIERFDFEQQKALDDFIRKQELEKSSYVQGLENKKSSSIELLKDSTQKDISNKKEKLLDEAMFDLKNQWLNQLSETKRLSVRGFESQIDGAVDDAWVNVQNALSGLKSEINDLVPTWKNELEEKRKLEQEDREERRKEEQLQVDKQRIELERQRLEATSNNKKQEEAVEIEKLINSKLSAYDQMLGEHLQKVIPTNTVEQPVTATPNNVLSSGKKNKGFLLAATAGVLAIGGFTGHALGNNNAAANPIQTEENSQLEELTSKLSLLEEQVVLPTAEASEKEDLDSLLQEKEYEKAMRSFKDPESLNKIEQTLFEDEELGALITFNKTNDSEFGAMDEAILSEDAEKVQELYKKMKDKEKESLSSDRKSSIALLLYQVGEKEMADKLLGTKKDK